MAGFVRGASLAAVLALTGPGAQAAESAASGAPASGLAALGQCRRQPDPALRLACYDEAAARLEAAEAKGEVVVVDQAQAQTLRRQAFGFTLPAFALLDRAAPAETLDSVSLRIESAQKRADGKWVFRLEGGQVWRQIDTAELSRTPKPGGQAQITRAFAGSYKLNIGGAASIRVHRDD